MAWRLRKRLYIWYCAAAYLSFLLVFLGLASSAWAQSSSDTASSQWGLLAFCFHDYQNSTHECGAYGFGDKPAWFDVSRTFTGLSAILLFSVTPLSCYLYHEDNRREDVLLLTVFGVVTAILGLIGAIVYAALRDADQGTLSWGFAVFVSGQVVAMALFLSLCAISVCQPKRKPAVKPYYM